MSIGISTRQAITRVSHAQLLMVAGWWAEGKKGSGMQGSSAPDAEAQIRSEAGVSFVLIAESRKYSKDDRRTQQSP